MPNTPSPHLPSGRLRRLAVRSTNCILLAVLLMLPAVSAQASQAVIDYHLAIGFELSAQTLHGTARLLVPAGQGLGLNMQGLTVKKVELDGKEIALAKEAILTLPPATVAQQIMVHFMRAYRDSPDNLVDARGIALTGLWHPRPDQDCRFHLQASLPNDFEAVSEADQIDTEVTAGGKTQRFSLAQPLQEISFVAGPYVVRQEPFGNGKTLYSYFFAEDAELAAAYRQKAKAYLERYQELIGPYPYQRFSIVENRLPTGYGMAGFTLLGQSVVRLPFITETSLGHEVLHAWFGNAVRVDQGQGNWCEGLTTYLADQAYAVDKGEGAAYRKEALLKYQHYVRPEAALAVKDFHGAEPGHDSAQQGQRAVGYGKAAMIFRMLENRLGHERFSAGLRNFYQTWKGRAAGWEALRQSFEAGGESLAPFFSQWLERQDVPAVTAEKISLEERDGVLTLAFTLHQAGDKPYGLEVPCLVFSATGVERKVVSMAAADQEVVWPLRQHPTALAIDPDYDVMRGLAASELPPSWDWFNGSAKKLAVVNSTAEYDLYQGLIDQLEAQGAEIMAANEVTDKDMADRAVIFLGTSGPAPRALFAKPIYPPEGLTVDLRTNPLNPLLPMALVSASAPAEVAAGLPKLRHYGKYGYLHLQNGRALDKRLAPAALGITYHLDEEPAAVEAPAALSFSGVMAKLAAKRVIYVGESHTRNEDHRLQLRVIRELASQGKAITIGMEMFPQASQAAIDAFVNGAIDEAQFLKQSKYFEVWRFDYRLYRDILNFARRHKIPVIALNIDRDMVSKVYSQGGVAGLSPEEAAALPVDRDLDLPGYRERIHEVYTLHPGRDEKQFSGFFQSQAIWDEIMAQTITDYLSSHPERQMVVLAGLGHVVKDNAIPPRVARRLAVDQAVVMGSDGSVVEPAAVDYMVFMPRSPLPPQALLGIVMNQAKPPEPVRIAELNPQGPAAKAGLQKDDTVLAVDGKAVEAIDDVKIILLDKKVGETVKIKIKRPVPIFPDQDLTVDVVL